MKNLHREELTKLEMESMILMMASKPKSKARLLLLKATIKTVHINIKEKPQYTPLLRPTRAWFIRKDPK
jgi:hypothetical protein